MFCILNQTSKWMYDATVGDAKIDGDAKTDQKKHYVTTTVSCMYHPGL